MARNGGLQGVSMFSCRQRKPKANGAKSARPSPADTTASTAWSSLPSTPANASPQPTTLTGANSGPPMNAIMAIHPWNSSAFNSNVSVSRSSASDSLDSSLPPVSSPAQPLQIVVDTPGTVSQIIQQDGSLRSRKRPALEEVIARPQKRLARENPYGLPIMMRGGRRCKIQMNMDVWALVFGHAGVRELLQCRRVCHEFHHLLHPESHHWKRALDRFWSALPVMPPYLPDGFSAFQFCELSEGKGCQVRGCSDKSARKVYWLFKARLCKQCARLRIRSKAALSTWGASGVSPIEVMNTLPSCTIDPYGNYLHMHEFAVPNHAGFSLKAFVARYEEFEAMQDQTTEARATLIAEFEDRRYETQNALLLLERRMMLLQMCQREARSAVRGRRRRFFEAKAAALPFPIRSEALGKIDAFRKALMSPREPTEHCWKMLLPKLLPHQKLAKAMVKKERWGIGPDVALVNAERLRREAHRFPVKARTLLSELAVTIANDAASNPPYLTGVEDLHDIIPVVLERVYRLYEEKKSPDMGRLLLRDTMWFIEKHLSPLFEEQADGSLLDLASYKCPACATRRTGIKRTFSGHLRHIINVHAGTTLGDFEKWQHAPDEWPPDTFWALEWPPHLPMLGKNQEAPGHWNLWSREDYQSVATAPSSSSTASASGQALPALFLGRTAVPSDRDFVGAVIYVLEKFKDCSLQPLHKSRIALQYGLETFRLRNQLSLSYSSPWSPPFEELSVLHERIIKSGFYDAFDNLPCGLCRYDRRDRYRNNRKVMNFGDLLSHVNSRHTLIMRHWDVPIFSFPSEHQTVLALTENADASRIFDELFPTDASLPDEDDDDDDIDEDDDAADDEYHNCLEPGELNVSANGSSGPDVSSMDAAPAQALLDMWRPVLHTTAAPGSEPPADSHVVHEAANEGEGHVPSSDVDSTG